MVKRPLKQKIGDLQTWSGIIQFHESGKACERPVVNYGDVVA